MELEIKRFGALEVKDAERGEVSAIVANLGVVDRDGDVIMPGALVAGSAVKLSGYGHDVVLADAPPAGIGTIAEEGDHLVFRGRYFMSTQRGREAFHTVKELGEHGEWSWGFPWRKVKTGELTEEWRAKGAKRVIVGALEAREASPVFLPAGHGTRTLSVKAEGADDSLTQQIEAVNNALWARNEKASEPWWAREVFEDSVIVQAGSKLLRIPYTTNEDGTITLGDGVEVEIVYQVVEKSAADADAPETKGAGPDLSAVAAEEFERLQRNLRKYRAV